MTVLYDLPQPHQPEIWPYLVAAIMFPRSANKRSRYRAARCNSEIESLTRRMRSAGCDPSKFFAGDELAAALGGGRREDLVVAAELRARRPPRGYFLRPLMAGLVLLHVLAQGPDGSIEDTMRRIGGRERDSDGG